MKRLVWMLLLLLPAIPALAETPQSANHRDADAPCYRWPAVDMDADGVFDRIDHCVNTPQGCTVDKWGCSPDADHDGVCDGLDKCADSPAGVKVNKEGCSESQMSGGEPPPSPPPTKIEPPHQAPPRPQPARPTSEAEKQLVEKGSLRLENIYFETGSARLLPESEATLHEAGAALAKYPALKVEVQGHTDTRGAAGYNLRLSQERSESVVTWLVNHYPLNADHFVARGYGETIPETRERNDEELLRNRRVMLKVLNPEVLPTGVQLEK